MKYLNILSVILFVVSLGFLYFASTKEPKTITRIEKEIHYIQSVRKEQSKEADKKVEKINTEYKKKISDIKKLKPTEIESTFNVEIPNISDTVEFPITAYQAEKCLKFKFKSEKDSAAYTIIKEDRDSCNEQVKQIVTKVDTIVTVAAQNEKKSFFKGVGFGVGITAAVVGIILLLGID